MQEQIVGQLVQQLQERVGLDQEKATQVATVVFEFLQQHSGEILKMVTEGGGTKALRFTSNRIFALVRQAASTESRP